MKRLINKVDYSNVDNWDEYKTTHTLLSCKCSECGVLYKRSIHKMDYLKKKGNRIDLCWSCSNVINRKKTSQEKYGTDHPRQNKDIYQKYENTMIQRYNVKIPMYDNNIKNKVSKIISSKEVQEKTKKTNKKRYGVEFISQLDETKKKVYNTRKKNNSFHTSKAEDRCYDILCNYYGIDNIIRQYKDNIRYPFACDFYISSDDLFIECNFHWTHRNEPFDSQNKEHQKILNEWKGKNTKYYNTGVDVWVNKDTKKAKIAKENNLNYITFYSEFDFVLYFKK